MALVMLAWCLGPRSTGRRRRDRAGAPGARPWPPPRPGRPGPRPRRSRRGPRGGLLHHVGRLVGQEQAAGRRVGPGSAGGHGDVGAVGGGQGSGRDLGPAVPRLVDPYVLGQVAEHRPGRPGRRGQRRRRRPGAGPADDRRHGRVAGRRCRSSRAPCGPAGRSGSCSRVGSGRGPAVTLALHRARMRATRPAARAGRAPRGHGRLPLRAHSRDDGRCTVIAGNSPPVSPGVTVGRPPPGSRLSRWAWTQW